MHPSAHPRGRSLTNTIRLERIWLLTSTRRNVSSSSIVTTTLTIRMRSTTPARIFPSVLRFVDSRGIQSSHGEIPHFCWIWRTNWSMVWDPTRMQWRKLARWCADTREEIRTLSGSSLVSAQQILPCRRFFKEHEQAGCSTFDAVSFHACIAM